MAKNTGKDKATRKVQRLEAREARRNPQVIDPQFHSGRNLGDDQGSFWSDPTDKYANALDNYIWLTSTISGVSVKFKAMLTQYEDQFSSEWNSEQVYGRNDPIQTFKNTTRKISIGWDAPAGSFKEAATNMFNAAELTRMLYPSYEQRRSSDSALGSVSTINKSPMIKVRFRNLIRGLNGTELLVTLDGITFAPDLEAGWFESNEDSLATSGREVGFMKGDNLVPKLLKFSCTMTVLHQTTIGHNGNNRWPYELSRFPNLPFSRFISRLGAANEARRGEDFEAEEEAQFDAALDKAIQDAADADMITSDRQIDRARKKADRQQLRARKLSANIAEARQAAGMELTSEDYRAIGDKLYRFQR